MVHVNADFIRDVVPAPYAGANHEVYTPTSWYGQPGDNLGIRLFPDVLDDTDEEERARRIRIGREGEIRFAAFLSEWMVPAIESSTRTYWSLSMRADFFTGFGLTGDLDCIIDFGSAIVCVDVKNYSARYGHVIVPDTPEAMSGTHVSYDLVTGETVREHRVHATMTKYARLLTQVHDAWKKVPVYRVVVAVPSMLDDELVDPLIAKGSLYPGRVPIMTMSGFLDWLSVLIITNGLREVEEDEAFVGTLAADSSTETFASRVRSLPEVRLGTKTLVPELSELKESITEMEKELGIFRSPMGEITDGEKSRHRDTPSGTTSGDIAAALERFGMKG